MRMDALRGPDAGTLLVRALRAMAAAADCPLRIDSIAGRPWASATFTGVRHVVVLAATPVPHLRSWLATLPDAGFALRGHLVADLCVDDIALRDGYVLVTLTILTLAEG